MSIYATLSVLKFPADGWSDLTEDYVEVWLQGVPGHIGTPTPGYGYENGDPYASFLPPAVTITAEQELAHTTIDLLRAVVVVTGDDEKGGEGFAGQQYANPLLVLTGEEYRTAMFDDLHRRIADELQRRYEATRGAKECHDGD